LTTNAGTSADFVVLATGDATIVYQWYKNGAVIPLGTNANYLISSIATSDVGSFSCLASNATGVTNSTAATLTVRFKPQFSTALPIATSALEGATVTFTAATLAVPGALYQWYANGATISGATNATYTLTNVRQSSQATYTILASNSIGVTNSATVLSVSSPVETDTQYPYPFQPRHTFPDSGGAYRQFGTTAARIAGTDVFIKIMNYIKTGSMESFVIERNSRTVLSSPAPTDMIMMSWAAWNLLNNGTQPFVAATYPERWLADEGGGRLPSLVNRGTQFNIVYVGGVNSSVSHKFGHFTTSKIPSNPVAVIIPRAMHDAMA
jgi:hypothetical protein